MTDETVYILTSPAEEWLQTLYWRFVIWLMDSACWVWLPCLY